MSLPVFIAFAITTQEAIAISLPIKFSSAGIRRIAASATLVKVRTLRVIRLSPTTVIGARVQAILVTAIVSAPAVIVILVVVGTIDAGVIVGWYLIASIVVTMSVAGPITVPVAPASPMPAAVTIPVTVTVSVATATVDISSSSSVRNNWNLGHRNWPGFFAFATIVIATNSRIPLVSNRISIFVDDAGPATVTATVSGVVVAIAIRVVVAAAAAAGVVVVAAVVIVAPAAVVVVIVIVIVIVIVAVVAAAGLAGAW